VTIRSRVATDEYRREWERVFRRPLNPGAYLMLHHITGKPDCALNVLDGGHPQLGCQPALASASTGPCVMLPGSPLNPHDADCHPEAD
jgi:hypothetical protein